MKTGIKLIIMYFVIIVSIINTNAQTKLASSTSLEIPINKALLNLKDSANNKLPSLSPLNMSNLNLKNNFTQKPTNNEKQLLPSEQLLLIDNRRIDILITFHFGSMFSHFFKRIFKMLDSIYFVLDL